MQFWSTFISTGIQYVIMMAFVAGICVLGATFRKKKDAAKKEEEQ